MTGESGASKRAAPVGAKMDEVNDQELEGEVGRVTARLDVEVGLKEAAVDGLELVLAPSAGLPEGAFGLPVGAETEGVLER
jgi:hypothetical protein